MIDVVREDIKQYFNYIKQMYLKTFDKYLTDKTKNRIINMSYEDIECDLESDFDMRVNGTIHYKLNINSFIENNNLLNEDLKDLSIEEQENVKYLIKNKDNVNQIVKDTVLESVFLLFMPNRDVLACGLSTYLAKRIAPQCNLNSLNIYYKEANIIEKLIDLLSEKTVLKSILNGNNKELEQKYDSYVTNSDNFKKIYSLLEHEFEHYYKNKNKIFYIDSLYNYSNLNYETVLNKIELIKSSRDKIKNITLARIDSISDCIQELNRYMILLREPEKNNLYYASLNLKRILEKDNFLNYTDEIFRIEQELKPIVDYIWNYYINYEGNYDPNSNYWFLIQNYNQIKDDKYQVMNLITNEHLKVTNTKNRYKYGFIYRIKSGAIKYLSPERIIFKQSDNNVEIEEQSYSSLLTPRNLLLQTLEKKQEYNSVVVDKEYVTIRAVYCICKSETDPDYEKAQELASKYEIPFIPLYESEEISR